MNIVRTTNMQEILQCVPIENEIRKKEKESLKLNDMLVLIGSNLDNPLFAIWMAYEDEKLVGYTIATLNPIIGMQSVHIHRTWYNQIYPEAKKKMWEEIRSFAKENNIKKLTITVTRRWKAIQRAWKFKPVSVNMERRI